MTFGQPGIPRQLADPQVIVQQDFSAALFDGRCDHFRYQAIPSWNAGSPLEIAEIMMV
jgi:hypothetical protein